MKTKKADEIIKREVGEKVKLKFNFDTDSAKAVGDDGDGILEATITTSAQDRHNENIATDGIETANYLSNPVVLYGHDYFGLPIGKTLKLTQQKNKIKARFQLAIEEYDFAATVYTMVKNGYLNAVSIGGIVREWSEDYKTILKMEMLEFSLVSIPANPDAMITARGFETATGKSLDTVAKEYDDFAHKTVLDKVKHMGNDEVNTAVKVLETLVATLKESANATSSAGKAEPTEVKRIKKVRLLSTAKAVNQESERIIRIIKLKT